MRASAFLISGVLVTMLASAVHAEPTRYRGEYTYGHEVNIFCPAINSQCYWLGSETPGEVRDALRGLAAANASKTYDPVCVVIEAEIDRETRRDGFAADHDGLITVTHLFGPCDQTNIVTHGDLQHHRWVLESISGEALDAEAMKGRIPELDFGEQMRVSGNSGCNRFSGRASLQENYIRFGQVISTLMSCTEEQNDVEQTIQALLAAPDINIEIDGKYLSLQAGEVSLRFRLQDWVH